MPKKICNTRFMEKADIQTHILATYTNLRVGIGIIAFLFPFGLWFIGRLLGVSELMASMSSYYHSPVQNLFVSVMIALGVFLFLYKGYSKGEDRALNAAGVLAVAVAFIPTNPPPGTEGFALPWLHGICAVTFFLCIAYVCIFKAKDTVPLVSDPIKRRRYRQLYVILGILLIVLPVFTALFIFLSGMECAVFWLEAISVWIFSIFWIVKGLEIHSTDLERSFEDHSRLMKALVN